MQTVRRPERQGGPERCRAMVSGMLPRSGWMGSEYGWQRCGQWTARHRCRPKTGNEIAVLSSANIKSGDFITVIWRRRGAGIVDNTYCKVLNFGNYRVMEPDGQHKKGLPLPTICLRVTMPAALQPSIQPEYSAMFNPSSDDVRRFFCETLRKHRAHEILTPMEAIALDWILEHPEYENELADVEAALARDYSVEGGQANPFLHLSMHLSITEQVQVDQPRGIRPAVQQLTQRLDSAHAAHHEVMECLGQMIWASQRSGLPPDTDAYIDCVRRR